jgi:hypothetical protein
MSATIIDDHPWRSLDPSLAPVLAPTLDETAAEMIDAVVATVPAYARPIEGEFGLGIIAGVQGALSHFLAEIEARGPVARPDVYRALGQGEMRAGRSMESLLSAYRIGARVAWRRFAAAGVAAGLEPGTLYRLAEGIFAYIDVLSAESAEGHAAEQSATAGELEGRRRQLVRMLVRDPPADPESVRAAAREAQWPLPRRLAAVALVGDARLALAGELGPDAIAESFGEVICALVADPDGPGRRAAIERAVLAAHTTAGLGTAVGWTRAATSFQRARAALALATPGEPPSLIDARANAGRLLLAADRGLASELSDDLLAPLDGLSPGARKRLTETLRAWLAYQGRLGQVALQLGVHPQTARYRLGRLRELFGDALEDPEARFWLEVALRVSPTADPQQSEG